MLSIFRDMRKKHVLKYTMVVTRVGIEKKIGIPYSCSKTSSFPEGKFIP